MADATRTPVESPVIDADGHVLEPLSAWEAVASDHRPRIVRDQTGYEHVIVGDQEILTVSLGALGTPGARMSDSRDFRPLEEALPGGFDPRLRIRDMDTEGIDKAVLYPSVGLYCWALRDTRAAVALSRAYNNWLAGYCAGAHGRLLGAAMVPMQDPQAAAVELRRAHDELDFPVAFVRPNPCLGRVLADPANEPLWEAAEDLGVAIGIHEGSSISIPTLGDDRQPFNPLVLHAVSHPFEMMLACTQLMAFGVMERHPGLKFVFLEAGAGWVPYWLERISEQIHGFGGFCPEMRLEPAEYFSRQCWVSCEVDEATVPLLAPSIGEDRIVWGSDYPHHDATFPGAVKELRETVAPLSPATQAKIIGTNATTLYGIA